MKRAMMVQHRRPQQEQLSEEARIPRDFDHGFPGDSGPARVHRIDDDVAFEWSSWDGRDDERGAPCCGIPLRPDRSADAQIVGIFPAGRQHARVEFLDQVIRNRGPLSVSRKWGSLPGMHDTFQDRGTKMFGEV